jgi:hypothetical protein
VDKETRGILVGMTVGDGYLMSVLQPDCRLRQVSLRIKHGIKQLAYIEHKADLLHSCLGGKRPKVSFVENNGYPGVVIQKQNNYFRILRNSLYLNGKKTLSTKILDRVTPHGLALWWMDDGCLSMKKRDGKIHAREGFLNTYTDFDETRIVCQWLFERFHIYAKPVFDRTAYRVRLNTQSLLTLIPLIKPYIIPSMCYKVDMHYE